MIPHSADQDKKISRKPPSTMMTSKTTKKILAADIGGTKALLALFETGPEGCLRLCTKQRYSSQDAPSLAALVERFLADCGVAAVDAAGFGFAGPVIEGRAHGVHLPWPASEEELRRVLGIGAIALLNDLAAVGHGLAVLTPAMTVTLKEGTAEAGGVRAVIAAGTGLGMTMVASVGDRCTVFASEGGHRDFAPRDATEYALYEYLHRRYGHTSIERVLSGPGLIDLYRFLLEQHDRPEPEWLADCLARTDAGAISRRGLAGSDPICRTALERFVSIYGAEAGNVALQYVATGGVYLAGGIAPQILDVLTTPIFRDAFLAKGRISSLLERIPVFCITDPDVPLHGAARCALDRMRIAT